MVGLLKTGRSSQVLIGRPAPSLDTLRHCCDWSRRLEGRTQADLLLLRCRSPSTAIVDRLPSELKTYIIECIQVDNHKKQPNPAPDSTLRSLSLVDREFANVVASRLWEVSPLPQQPRTTPDTFYPKEST